MVATTQELCRRTQKFVQLNREYLGMEEPIFQVMETRPCHIDFFERQYDKAFSGDCLLGAYIVDRIHKRVKVLLYSCNTKSLEDVKTGALSEIGEFQGWMKSGEWITPPPRAWVKLP